ncbi:MAG: replication restart helicase PriA, partial [Gammaproteobacteria bacterium]
MFDYLPPADGSTGRRGQRVAVPFGRTRRVGFVCEVRETSDVPPNKLRPAIELLDEEALLDERSMDFLEWAADYYHHPFGEVISAALPAALRKGAHTSIPGDTAWRLTDEGANVDSSEISRRAPVQGRLLTLLQEHPEGLVGTELAAAGATWRRALRSLEHKRHIERFARDADDARSLDPKLVRSAGPEPSAAQRHAIHSIGCADGFRAFLLDGVTGSGKTEVYLRCIERELTAGRQSLVIVPEIGLTPQLLDRFQRRLNTIIAVMHSGLTDTARLQAWCGARDGTAGVIIGTRSAVFVPLRAAGLIVIDEEHDTSLKQQEGFRYSARDLAVWRARQLGIPVVMGSATPSFESLENVSAGRYTRLSLPRRAGAARQPEVRLIDLRRQPAKDGLTEPLRNAIGRHLRAEGQVLVYLNRRGFSPSLLCTDCGALVECRRCDARMVFHQRRGRLICHHCGAERDVPDACDECGGNELLPV